MIAGLDVLADLLRRGHDAGVFFVPDPAASALRILVLVDGVLVQVSMRSETTYGDVHALVRDTVEREVGLPHGSLRSQGGRMTERNEEARDQGEENPWVHGAPPVEHLEVVPYDEEWPLRYAAPPQPGVPPVPLQPPGRRSHPRTAHTFDAALATHPALTGVSRQALDHLVTEIREMIDTLPPEQRPRHRKLTVRREAPTQISAGGQAAGPVRRLFLATAEEEANVKLASLTDNKPADQ
ncbi:hypothetical protein [Streptomyces sp. LS1784]|uniref:hypothetical protein n=1 Tax=Streptomyces sp. LS1784 TaxID=2851533 RepID=UPI0021E108B2|nr:hypothetical protein [Streptomyces sp. LS1784]